MFCPKCGNKDVVDVFCERCLREEKPLVKSFKECRFKTCILCRAALVHGKWERGAEQKAVHLVHPGYAEIAETRITGIHPSYKPGLKDTGIAVVTVTGRASKRSKMYEETYELPFVIENTLCEKCRKLGTQYFEGTLQVRNENAETERFLKQHFAHAGVILSKRIPLPKGGDYLLPTKVAVRQAARALIDRFGGLEKQSRTLFSRNSQTSKDIYRISILVTLPPFRVGDAIMYDAVYQVLGLGKRLKLRDLRRNKIAYLTYRQEMRPLPVFETTIAATEPRLPVIHPETFQAVPVVNACREGERMRGVVLDGKAVYMICSSE